jgi:hypothetical protein
MQTTSGKVKDALASRVVQQGEMNALRMRFSPGKTLW